MNTGATIYAEEGTVIEDSYDIRVSSNLAAAKGFAALIVMAGHIGTGIPNYWVVVTTGLLIFSISSAYFTRLKYHDDFQWSFYWKRKAVRLLPKLFVIEFFLLILFIVQGRQHLWTMDTALYIIPGLPGFLAWFHVPNSSPYGLGMWFLSLLLIFYFVFPFLERLYDRIGPIVVTAFGVVILYILNQKIIYGHALWLTASGFLVGMLLASWRPRLNAITSLLAVITIGIAMISFHAILKFDGINFFFILLISVGLVLFFFEAKLPSSMLSIGGWLSGLLLEIYLLHPYIKISPSGIYRLDQLISVALIIIVSWALAWLSNQLVTLISQLGKPVESAA